MVRAAIDNTGTLGTTALLARLDDCLAREIVISGRLLENLRDENAALSGNDPERIGQVAGNKQQTLAELEALDREREDLLHAAGFRNGRETPEDYITRCDPQQQTTILRNWRRLIELAEACQRQNTINGALIQSGLRHTRHALSLLQGQPATETTAYGPRGQLSAGFSGHSLGKV